MHCIAFATIDGHHECSDLCLEAVSGVDLFLLMTSGCRTVMCC